MLFQNAEYGTSGWRPRCGLTERINSAIVRIVSPCLWASELPVTEIVCVQAGGHLSKCQRRITSFPPHNALWAEVRQSSLRWFSLWCLCRNWTCVTHTERRWRWAPWGKREPTPMAPRSYMGTFSDALSWKGSLFPLPSCILLSWYVSCRTDPSPPCTRAI